MPRLKNTTTGVVVNVDDATAKRLGSEWGPVDAAPAPTKRKPGRPRNIEPESE